MDATAITEKIVNMAIEYGPKVLGALVVLIVGLWIIGRIVGMLGRMMDKRGVDASLQPFLRSLASVLLKIILFIVIAEMVGVKTTSMIAVLGALGLAIGLALQGSLANFAGGVLILLFKPYRVGDLIEAQDQFGEVESIQIFNTVLHSPGNKRVIMPNGAVSNGVIKNYSELGKLRVDIPMGISYNDDIQLARNTIMEVASNHPAVLKDPAPEVHVTELGDNSVNLQVRPWATPENYWGAFFGVLEESKKALDAKGISIPFPQRDVHLYNHQLPN